MASALHKPSAWRAPAARLLRAALRTRRRTGQPVHLYAQRALRYMRQGSPSWCAAYTIASL
jgi:hypothetical protein